MNGSRPDLACIGYCKWTLQYILIPRFGGVSSRLHNCVLNSKPYNIELKINLDSGRKNVGRDF
jgi:hypothetical protein